MSPPPPWCSTPMWQKSSGAELTGIFKENDCNSHHLIITLLLAQIQMLSWMCSCASYCWKSNLFSSCGWVISLAFRLLALPLQSDIICTSNIYIVLQRKAPLEIAPEGLYLLESSNSVHGIQLSLTISWLVVLLEGPGAEFTHQDLNSRALCPLDSSPMACESLLLVRLLASYLIGPASFILCPCPYPLFFLSFKKNSHVFSVLVFRSFSTLFCSFQLPCHVFLAVLSPPLRTLPDVKCC